MLASDDAEATLRVPPGLQRLGALRRSSPTSPTARTGSRHAPAIEAGNVDDTPATRTFTIDTVAPDTLFTATLAAAPAPPVGMGTSTFAVSPSGVAAMGVTCPAGAPSACEGELALDRETGDGSPSGSRRLEASPGGLGLQARAGAGARASAAIPLASTRYSVAPGQTKQVAVTLPDAARWVIEREGKLAAIVRLTPRRGTATRRPVTLKASPNQPRFLDAGLNVRVKQGVAKLRVRCATKCKGTLTVSVNGKRVGKAAIRNGVVKVRVKPSAARRRRQVQDQAGHRDPDLRREPMIVAMLAALALAGPSGPTNDNTPTFTWTGENATCAVDGGDAAPCTSPVTLGALPTARTASRSPPAASAPRARSASTPSRPR